MGLVGWLVGRGASAIADEEASKRKQDPTWYWLTRGLVAVTLLAGWIFILVQNKFHVDPPLVVVMLGYLAVVMTVTNLWRVGAAAVATDDGADTWGKPLGARGELEREKQALLKSIQEAKFDQAMGKLSTADFEQLNNMYRARAIEVIKALEEMDAGAAETPRQKIEREVAARLKIEEKGEKRGKKKADDKKAKAEEKKAEADEKKAEADEKKAKAEEKAEAEAEAKAADAPTPEPVPVKEEEAAKEASS